MAETNGATDPALAREARLQKQREYNRAYYKRKRAHLNAAKKTRLKKKRAAKFEAAAQREVVARKQGKDDVEIFLRRAVRNINSRLQSGDLAEEDTAHLLCKLAYKVLKGEM